MKRNQMFGLHASPPFWLKVSLALMPFIIVVAIYLYGSHIRHQANPSDKLLPSVGAMVSAIDRVAFTPDKRNGDYLLWKDTVSSLSRLGMGLLLATTCALLLGLNMGVFPGLSALISSFLTTTALIPPLAILPVLLVTFGVGELGKVALIFIGTFPLLTRDIWLAVKQLPKEQIPKALTLGASQLAITYKIILPQIMPKLLTSVRLSLGAAWLFLIAAEAIASTDGLGYRIFLVRRYMSMDIIIPYVIWITLLGFTLDYLLKMATRCFYPWYSPE